MKFTELDIPGCWLIKPDRYGDDRGYFSETFREDLFRKHVRKVDFVQENESMSVRGVIRGLHFQRGCHAQAKLVRVSRGCVLDVGVDLRPDSPAFGRYVAVELSAANGYQLYLPRGMAHGFAVLSDEAVFQYKVDNYYAPESEATVRYDDPSVGVSWPVRPEVRVLSPKDLAGGVFDEMRDVFDEFRGL